MGNERKGYIDSMLNSYIDSRRERTPLSRRAAEFFLPEKKERKEREERVEKPAEPVKALTEKELSELEKAEEEELKAKKDFLQHIRAFFFPERVRLEQDAYKEKQEKITKLVLYRDRGEKEVKFLLDLVDALLARSYRRTREEFRSSAEGQVYQKIRERLYSGDESP